MKYLYSPFINKLFVNGKLSVFFVLYIL